MCVYVLENLIKLILRKYVTDSALTNGVPISQSAVPRHVPNQDSEADSSDEEYSWKCQCRPSSSRSIVCTVRDGEICQCVGSFGKLSSLGCITQLTILLGNFYSTSKPSDRPQTLNLKALPENLPLVECSPLCACALACANRLTQRGITWVNHSSPSMILMDSSVPMEIRPTHTGLGAFITHRIPYGTFVSLYAGEYLTTHEARDRWKEGHTDNYTLSLRIPGSTTHIDPRRIGNVGRFLNHSCAPNCVILVVRWGGGCTWPRAAIFVSRRFVLYPLPRLWGKVGRLNGADGYRRREPWRLERS